MSVQKDFFANPLSNYEGFHDGSTQTYQNFYKQTDYIIDLSNNYGDIGNKVVEYKDMRNKIKMKSGYDADGNPEDYIDFSGNWLDYTDRKMTLKDATKEDIHMMIIQQNNAYIIGMITIATVLVTTYLVIKK